MPSLTNTVTTTSLGHARSGSLSTSGGSSRPPIASLSTTQIKESARKEIPSILKGVSPSHSIISAKKLGEGSILKEENGELKEAYWGYSRVAVMLAHIINQPEFKNNQNTLFPSFDEVMKWTNANITERSKKLEKRLREIEEQSSKQRASPKQEETHLPSVAERIKSLQENGLMAAASSAVKSRRIPPSPAAKPARLSHPPSLQAHHPNTTPTSPSPTQAPLTSPRPNGVVPLPLFPSVPSHSQQTPTQEFVSLASLGPPSPTSTVSPTEIDLGSDSVSFGNLAGMVRASSPEFEERRRRLQFESNGNGGEVTNLNSPTGLGNARAFPTLEEWEASQTSPTPMQMPLSLIPGGTNANGNDVWIPPAHTPHSPTRYSHLNGNPSVASSSAIYQHQPSTMPSRQQPSIFPQSPPSTAAPSHSRKFSVSSITRPASTPPRPLPPPEADSPPQTSPTDLGPGMMLKEVDPRDVYLMQRRGKKVLFLDLRRRAESERVEVRGEVVSLDVDAQGLDEDEINPDTLSSLIRTTSEKMLFQNRRAFSQVIIFESGEGTTLSNAVAAALGPGRLKTAPLVLRGGFDGWMRDVGEVGIVRSSRRRGSSSSGGTGNGSVSRHATGNGTGLRKTPTGEKLAPSTTGGSGSSGGSGAPIPASLQPGAVPLIPSPVEAIDMSGIGSPSNSKPTPPPQPQLQHPPQLQPSNPQQSFSTSNSPGPGPSSRPSPSQPQPPNQQQFWVYKGDEKPQQRASIQYGMPTPPSTSRPLENGEPGPLPNGKTLTRKPAMTRPSSMQNVNLPISYPSTPASSQSPRLTPSQNFAGSYPTTSASTRPPSGPISYPSAPLRMSMPAPQLPPSSYQAPSPSAGVLSPLPQASINPGAARRRSDYLDQPPPASSLSSRPSIDYPEYGIRPPPPIAPASGERQDQRPRIPPVSAYPTSTALTSGYRQSPPPPSSRLPSTVPSGEILPSDYPVMYWSDYQVSTSGLKNLGNTCYMNSTIQCLSSAYPFAIYFSDGRFRSSINKTNHMGSKGAVALAFASLLHQMRQGDMSYLIPQPFRKSICLYAPQFSGSDQHDAEEFLNFLLDGLHEDLNRVSHKVAYKPSAEREAELERLPQQVASEQEWRIYRMSNNSIMVDYFQGQFRNRLQCLTCMHTSTTYNSFADLALPIPAGRGLSRVSLKMCLDAFVKEEIMEKSEAWHCPKCKTLRRASKQLSLSRLPAVLIIVLKRFSFKGPFTDKLETLVEFPIKELDLTNYMPPPLPPSSDSGTSYAKMSKALSDDPSIQIPPYKYDLFAVTNHYGSLSSGHYTAFINARGGWQYCDDSRIAAADTRDIVGKAAYVLYYKRTRPSS